MTKLNIGEIRKELLVNKEMTEKENEWARFKVA